MLLVAPLSILLQPKLLASVLSLLLVSLLSAQRIKQVTLSENSSAIENHDDCNGCTVCRSLVLLPLHYHKNLPKVDEGTTIKLNVSGSSVSLMYARKEMAWTVLPRPISSANTPFSPC